MAAALRNCCYKVACFRLRFTTKRHVLGRVSEFSTTITSNKDPELDDIFPHLRRSSRLSAEEYAKIESYVKKDLADVESEEVSGRDEDRDDDEFTQMFLNEEDSPNTCDPTGEDVTNKFWENVFNNSYNMKKLDAPEKPKRLKQTFMNMGESEPWEQEGMLPDDEDDLTSLGHGELELHRELRHYARLAAWEMPLLYSKLSSLNESDNLNLRKPFNPPTIHTPLRFRYTTYMGEQHPAENKVVLEFSPSDIPDLTDSQRIKLRKIAGVRWNPERDIVKMSCESYGTQAQNKRYLGDIFASLVKEAKDTTDTMEDIPLSTKHHTFKQVPQFPQEWIINKNRQKELEEHRRQLIKKDKDLETEGLLVDGVSCVQTMLEEFDKAANMIVPEVTPAGSKGQGKTIAVKR
ncbi:hypothetical protein Golomagni_04583 [Golovinomyces magnicellulatus]|nr:hypothetical protein Golomagni_04583 [Golovinomyces magnicellulatus]